VTVVVPVHNEQGGIDYLLRAMAKAAQVLAPRHELRLLVVDDGSTDGTWDELEQAARAHPGLSLVRHERNRGVGAAILTGIRAASTELVASVDCDCSYDPAELAAMLPMLEDADLVTASPYHPQGKVANVPPWRLFLSRTLSRLYQRELGAPIHTWTSCFRAYRRSAVADLELERGGFLGVAELLVRVLRRGGRVVEHPATLERRLLGTSKMKLLRTILGHLGLLWQVHRGRI
jgi:glycosyltransferase involved in cell wall biosynthesis